MISTIPLDITLRWLDRPDLASRLQYSSSHIVGLGLRGKNPHDTKCWLYYPEDNCPYYRCTVFSHYGVGNIPSSEVLLPTLRYGDSEIECDTTVGKPGPYWSLMFEISESNYKPVNPETIVEVK